MQCSNEYERFYSELNAYNIRFNNIKNQIANELLQQIKSRKGSG